MPRPSLLAALLAVLLCPTLARAVEGKAEAAKKAAGEPKLLLTIPGKLLLDEPFTAESWQKNWANNWHKGDWQIVGDQLRVAEKPEEGHHPEIGYSSKGGGPLHDVIVRCRFRYDGCKWMGFGFTDKEHVARIMMNDGGLDLLRMSGIGPTTKSVRLDHQSVKWDPAKWYTMTIELLGNELIANLDDQVVLYGQSDGMDIDKNRVTLIVGGQYGWYDEMKIWAALPDPAWEKRKPAVLAQKEKRK